MSLQEAISRVQQAANASTRDEYGKQTKIMKEIHRLQLVAEKPDEGIMRLRWQFMTTFAIRFAIEYGIISAICEMSGEPLSAAELSRTTGAEELLIVRTMRLVTYEGVCEEVAHGVYAANAKTKFLALPGILNGFTHIYDFGYKVTGLVPELIRNGKLSQFPSGPDERSPMQHACGDTMFGILSKEPRRKKIFDDYMEARRYSKEPKWLDIFPADKLEAVPGQVLIVDVGGGKGHDLVLFRQRFPHMTGEMIVQDLPRTFASLAEKPQGITLMEHDFFTEQPVKGASAYFLRSIMHDWADEECVTILRNIVAAMDSEKSCLLIDDFVVPETDVDWMTASLDLCMWLFFSGIERTFSQWQKLFDAVGLEVVKVWATPSSKSNVIELRKDSSKQ